MGNNWIAGDSSGTAVENTHYYPFGMSFKRNSGSDPYLYNGKEFDQMHGLDMYDYSARFYEPAAGRFSTMDPMAEKYYSISPYVYCANNPIKYIDLKGDSLTHHGESALYERVDRVHNNYLDGYYTFTTTSNGVTSLVATDKDRTQDPAAFARAEVYFNELNTVVNGPGMTHVRLVDNSENALVGNFNLGMIDIGDIEQLPLVQGNNIVTQGSTLIHETVEQYQTQVKGLHKYNDAHRAATVSESNIIGVTIDPNRITENISRPGPATGFMKTQASDGRQQTMMFRYNNNISIGNIFR